MGPASPQLQLGGVGGQQHPRTKPVSYWYSLPSLSLMLDVVVSELCLSRGTQMHCKLLLPLFQAQVLVDSYALKAFYFQLAYKMEGGPQG